MLLASHEDGRHHMARKSTGICEMLASSSTMNDHLMPPGTLPTKDWYDVKAQENRS